VTNRCACGFKNILPITNSRSLWSEGPCVAFWPRADPARPARNGSGYRGTAAVALAAPCARRASESHGNRTCWQRHFSDLERVAGGLR
jgi:hypothetical protein